MGAEAFDDGAPDRRGQRGLDTHHAVDVDTIGIAAAKQLGVLNRAAMRTAPTSLSIASENGRRSSPCVGSGEALPMPAAGAGDNAAAPR